MWQKKSKKKRLEVSVDKPTKKMLFKQNTVAKRKRPLSQKHRLTAKNGYYFIWGYHAVKAALLNPDRVVKTFYASLKSKNIALELARDAICKIESNTLNLAFLEVEQFELTPDSSSKMVHQHLMVEVKPLEICDLSDVLFGNEELRIVVLDQVTDPRNVGAIIRSANAFGCSAIIMTKHKAPSENGSLARAAAGALENIPIITVTNMHRTIETLKSRGICCIGLDASGSENIQRFNQEPRLALILGSENTGMRRLTKKACDYIVKIPMKNHTESLNVSVASAIALYATQINTDQISK